MQIYWCLMLVYDGEQMIIWLVVWNIFLCFHTLGISSSQLTIFQRGRYTTHQLFTQMIFADIYPVILPITLWLTNIAMENHYCLWVNPLFLRSFSIATLVYQRVSQLFTNLLGRFTIRETRRFTTGRGICSVSTLIRWWKKSLGTPSLQKRFER